MFQYEPNVSSDQTIPFDDVRASMLVQEFHTLIDRKDVYSIMNFVKSVKSILGRKTPFQKQKQEKRLFL